MTRGNGRAANPLVAKLSQFAPLSDGDVVVLEAMCQREERFRAGTNIVVEGETPRAAFVVTRGIAHRYRLMPDGRRQILTILIGGLTPDYLKLSSTPPEVLRYFDDLERDRAAPPPPGKR